MYESSMGAMGICTSALGAMGISVTIGSHSKCISSLRAVATCTQHWEPQQHALSIGSHGSMYSALGSMAACTQHWESWQHVLSIGSHGNMYSALTAMQYSGQHARLLAPRRHVFVFIKAGILLKLTWASRKGRQQQNIDYIILRVLTGLQKYVGAVAEGMV